MFGTYIEPEYHYYNYTSHALGQNHSSVMFYYKSEFESSTSVFDFSVSGLMKSCQFVFNGTLTVQHASGLRPTTL